MKISYFGDQRSHTYAAALALMQAEGICADKTVGCDAFYETLRQVSDGECDMGVVPIENSVEGTVVAAEDALSALRLFIVREIVLPVRQSLIVQQGVTLKDIQTVYSHPQALAQCRNTLRTLLPRAVPHPVAFTSAGLALLNDKSAAIARAPEKGQTALYEDIADEPNNCTRFLAVSKEPRNAGGKVSVMFSTKNESGALYRVLGELTERRLNMTKIESRPSKKRMGEYVFYADFLLGGGDLDEIMQAIQEHTQELQFLGRYAPCET